MADNAVTQEIDKVIKEMTEKHGADFALKTLTNLKKNVPDEFKKMGRSPSDGEIDKQILKHLHVFATI